MLTRPETEVRKNPNKKTPEFFRSFAPRIRYRPRRALPAERPFPEMNYRTVSLLRRLRSTHERFRPTRRRFRPALERCRFAGYRPWPTEKHPFQFPGEVARSRQETSPSSFMLLISSPK